MDMSSMVRNVGCAGCLALVGACGAEADFEAENTAETEFATTGDALRLGRGEATIEFYDCTETASIAAIDPALVNDRVPAGYTLAGDASTALLVVRVADCESIVVGGRGHGAGTVSQIGVTLTAEDGTAGPDETADINNYALWFSTDNWRVAAALRSLGVRATFDPFLDYSVEWETAQEGEVRIRQVLPRRARYLATGPVFAPNVDPSRYVATWWQDGPRGSVKMQTELPAIRFGGATMSLHTGSRSELSDVIGGTDLAFAVFDSFNVFDEATLTATIE